MSGHGQCVYGPFLNDFTIYRVQRTKKQFCLPITITINIPCKKNLLYPIMRRYFHSNTLITKPKTFVVLKVHIYI